MNGNSGTGVSALIGSGGTAVNQIKNGGLKIDTASFNATIARGLANFTGHTGVLTKEGTGTLTMAAAGNTYSQTVVNGGVLDFIATDAFGNHTSSAHVLTVNAGALVTNSTIAGGFNTFQNLTLNGGELRATNTLNALSGTFQAYHIRGTVTVGGTTASTISNVITVAAALAFGGTLNVTNLGGTLVEGQSFDLFDFDFAQSSGIFSAVNLPSLDSGLEWNASALYTTGVISVIPEPGTPALLASLAGMLTLRRRRK